MLASVSSTPPLQDHILTSSRIALASLTVALLPRPHRFLNALITDQWGDNGYAYISEAIDSRDSPLLASDSSTPPLQIHILTRLRIAFASLTAAHILWRTASPHRLIASHMHSSYNQ